MNEVNYAGFWIRFVASFIDTIFLALPLAIVVYFLSDGHWFDFAQYQQNMQMAMSGNMHALDHQPQPSMRWELLFEILVLAVSAIFWRKFKGATPGKKLLHIKIVDAKTFEDINNKQAITRSIGYIVSTLLLLIGFLMVAFKKDKRSLHDMLAGTSVIFESSEGEVIE